MQQQLYLAPGATVYGADGEKVGTMQTYSENYIVVEKGFFFPTDYYIPVRAIASANEEEIFLDVSKDEALKQGWEIEPTDDVATAPHIGVGDRQQGLAGEGNRRAEMSQQRIDESSVRVPVHEEHLEATTHREAAGDVEITKRVVTEQETVEVPVNEERVRVEWKAPSGDATVGEHAFEEGSIEIPVSREEVDISKRTVQTGELEVSKEQQQRTQ